MTGIPNLLKTIYAGVLTKKVIEIPNFIFLHFQVFLVIKVLIFYS